MASIAVLAVATIAQYRAETEATELKPQAIGSDTGCGVWIVTICAAAAFLWMCVYVKSIGGMDGLFLTMHSTQLADMVCHMRSHAKLRCIFDSHCPMCENTATELRVEFAAVLCNLGSESNGI